MTHGFARAAVLALAGSAALILPATITAAPAAQAANGHQARQARPAIVPWPVTVTIRTAPALPGVTFTFDGSVLVTDAAGVAAFTGQHDLAGHTLALTEPRITTSDRRYEFARWSGERNPNEAFQPVVTGLPLRADYTVTAAFTATCPVTPRFASQQGTRLDPARISHVELKGSSGNRVALPATGTTWLSCLRPVYRASTLRTRPVSYAVQSMIVGATNVVYAGVEHFEPASTPRPVLIGHFHNLTITAHDAMFGSQAGTTAVLTLPGGRVRRIPFGSGHAVTMHGLPQGDYKVAVAAGGAVVSRMSIRLSRDQTVNLRVISSGDLAALGGIVLVAGAGLPLLSATRRRRLAAWLRGRRAVRGIAT